MSTESARATPSGPRITFVLGKPIHKSPVLPDIAAYLAAEKGLSVDAVAPREPAEIADLLPRLEASDLLVLRGLVWPVLDELDRQEQLAERWVNTPGATAAVTDRWYLTQSLEAAGVPVPATRQATEWAEVVDAGPEVVVKAADGRRGRSAGVLLPGAERPTTPDIHGPWLIQEPAPPGSWEAKCYVVGDSVRVLRRPIQTADTGAPDSGAPEEIPTPGSDLVEVARSAARVAGLALAGVDVLVAPSGAMVVIDINAFPSAARLPGAAAWAGEYLSGLVTG